MTFNLSVMNPHFRSALLCVIVLTCLCLLGAAPFVFSAITTLVTLMISMFVIVAFYARVRATPPKINWINFKRLLSKDDLDKITRKTKMGLRTLYMRAFKDIAISAALYPLLFNVLFADSQTAANIVLSLCIMNSMLHGVEIGRLESLRKSFKVANADSYSKLLGSYSQEYTDAIKRILSNVEDRDIVILDVLISAEIHNTNLIARKIGLYP